MFADIVVVHGTPLDPLLVVTVHVAPISHKTFVPTATHAVGAVLVQDIPVGATVVTCVCEVPFSSVPVDPIVNDWLIR